MKSGGELVRQVLRRLRRTIRPTALERPIDGLGLGRGDLAIDCGANVGHVTAALARTGAEVHAFEPNPQAFSALVELHDRHIPELQPENQRLRERLVREGLTDRVLTDWG